MTQITGGAVEYTRPSSYQAEKPGAKVTLTFTVADGASSVEAGAMLDQVATMAMAKANDMVSRRVLGTAVLVSGNTSGKTPAPTPAVEVPQEAVSNVVPLQIGAPAAGAAPASSTVAPTPAAPAVEPATIDNKTLQAHCVDAMKRVMTQHKLEIADAANLIREQVIRKFAPGHPAPKAEHIPQEQRAAFVAEISAYAPA